MIKIEDGGPAFPVVNPLSTEGNGMSLRDYFAAKAMQGELAAMVDGEDDVSGLPLDIGDASLERLAKHWYRLADAMIRARSNHE